jgi:hypothetical protein
MAKQARIAAVNSDAGQSNIGTASYREQQGEARQPDG